MFSRGKCEAHSALMIAGVGVRQICHWRLFSYKTIPPGRCGSTESALFVSGDSARRFAGVCFLSLFQKIKFTDGGLGPGQYPAEIDAAGEASCIPVHCIFACGIVPVNQSGDFVPENSVYFQGNMRRLGEGELNGRIRIERILVIAERKRKVGLFRYLFFLIWHGCFRFHHASGAQRRPLL